jgi:hypothetical protein
MNKLILILFLLLIILIIKKETFQQTNSPKIAVISSIFGNYENIKDHLNVKNNNLVDWYCFNDSIKEKNIGVWNIINKPYHLINTTDQVYKNSYNNIINNNTRNMMYAKYYKIQTHKIDILEKYDYYIWIDGSLYLRDNFVNNILNLINSNKNIDLINFKHSSRSNIKDETYFCKDWKKYKDQELENQHKNYINSGFPDNIGLFELTSFYRKNNKQTNNVFDNWWLQNQKFSYQDQLSLPYSIWKSNKINHLVLNENVMNNDKYCLQLSFNSFKKLKRLYIF